MIQKHEIDSKNFSGTLHEVTEKLNFVRDVIFVYGDDSGVRTSIDSLNGAAYILWDISKDIEAVCDTLYPGVDFIKPLEAEKEAASPKNIQDTLSEGDNCLKCAKWNNGKGLEVLYQSGIYPAILHTESIMKGTSDLMTIRQLDIIVDCLQGVGDAITNFQVELGIIDEMTEAAGEAKPQSTFEDPRFSEYVAQINIDGHKPVDILEAWLKEHNPEFLKDD